MRSANWLVAATVVVLATSCGENSTKDSTTETDSTAITNTQNPVPVSVNDNLDVPEPARTAFQTKYPTVSNPTWRRYESTDYIDWEWSGWPTMDTSDYVVQFNMDNSDHWAWYDSDNNWVGTVSRVSDHASLPEAVNKLIQKDFAGYTIVEVDKENDRNRTAYEVDLTKGEDKMKVLISETGTIIKKKSVVDGTKTKEKNM